MARGQEIRAPTDHLNELIKASWKDAAALELAVQMRSVADKATQAVLYMLENKSTDYMMAELDDTLHEFEEWGQNLAKLQVADMAVCFTSHLRYVELQRGNGRSLTS
jgi:hypothetical protein